ncbi:hypothetical protein L6164_000054 [Bauhinia variegata]|uniref:Uncharacterized protein n=1 Tax=Bauhinia variegata TaxID=167791 RepID=A0ACB9QAY0_BAUVA|nr:hypothetical protein L6164_000054 [Bauhinia variegata]
MVSVCIKSSYTVTPIHPTPNDPLWLSEFDQLYHPAISFVSTVYVYKPNQNQSTIFSNATEIMRDSLSKILVHYYPVAGRLRGIDGGRFEIDCNAKGVTMLEAESTKTVDEYGDFLPREPIKELLPTLEVDLGTPMDDVPLMLVQLTRFRCGSLCVATKISHSLFDGISGFHFIKSWTKIARGEALEEDEMPFMDRTILKSRPPLMAPCIEHREFKPFPRLRGGTSGNKGDQAKKDTEVALLELTSEQVGKIKNKANQVPNEHDTEVPLDRPYSRFESIAAHLWRSIAKARQNDTHQPTLIVTIGDIRNRLKPQLPKNYIGNAIVQTVTPTCLTGDIISKPLSYVANKVRGVSDILTDEYIRSQLNILTSQDRVDWVKSPIRSHEHIEDHFHGNPNIFLASWLGMPVNGADFGWGKPFHIVAGTFGGDGTILIMPGLIEDGSLLILISLEISHIEAFKTFFYEDI